MSQPPLVSAAWLRQQLENRAPDLVLLDASWDPTVQGDSRHIFVEKHIPGALYFDLGHCVKPRPTCARGLPELTEFAEYARSLGISSRSHIVAYDRTDNYLSARTWWLFKTFGHESVSVLDGGLVKWEADGYKVVSCDEISDTEGDFDVRVNRSNIVEFDEMLEIIKSQRPQIVDTRNKEHFSGQTPEPCIYVELGLHSKGMPIPPTMHAGHMPGALNIPYPDFLDGNTMCFLPKENLLKLFADAGVDLAKPIVSTCYLGYSAAVVHLAALFCGHEHMKVYYGSWTEYGQLAPEDAVVQGVPHSI